MGTVGTVQRYGGVAVWHCAGMQGCRDAGPRNEGVVIPCIRIDAKTVCQAPVYWAQRFLEVA
jgi:hypothetical protein